MPLQRHICLALTGALFSAATAFGAFDWEAGPWGVNIGTNGTAGSPSCPVVFPSGTQTGTAVAVHYELAPADLPQLWVFLTDGFWRQTSRQSQFLTSYRLFRYHSSTNEDRDRLIAERIQILGTNAAGELEIETTYNNNALAGDRFHVVGRVTLASPDSLQTAMRAEIVISNATGQAVSPGWPGHRDLAEQWEIFSISSMFVADHLTGGLPAWYNGLDSGHLYVGITNDADVLNDGYSQNGSTHVSTHDTKYIVVSNTQVTLNHDTNLCPAVVVPAYEWYKQLVMTGEVSRDLHVQHAYDSSRNHCVRIDSCAGLCSDATNLKWAVTYNRDDVNMVDGDNVQIKLGMDDFLDIWPADATQSVCLHLFTGDSRPAITALSVSATGLLTVAWTTEPGEWYNLKHTPMLGTAWSNAATNVSGPDLGPLTLPPGFLRVVETNSP